MEWAIGGLVGMVAGYGIRLWQEKAPKAVKQPAEAALRTVGSALGAGARLGGRAASAGASLGADAVQGGVATMAAGAGAVSRAATRRPPGRARGGTLTKVPVSDGKAEPARKPRRRTTTGRATTGRTTTGRTTAGRATTGRATGRPSGQAGRPGTRSRRRST